MTDRFVAYCRVSTEKQGHSGLGLEAQRQRILQYVHPDQVSRWFQDIESGTKADRAGLEAALAFCEVTGSTLVCATLDRLSRDVLALELIKRRCAAGGFEFRCADLPEADCLTIGIMAQLAQYERQKISERTKAALAAARDRGQVLGNPLGAAAFKGRQDVGRERGRAVLAAKADEVAAKRGPILREMQDRGLSLAAMARELNDQGVTTARGGTWTATAVRRMLARLELAAA